MNNSSSSLTSRTLFVRSKNSSFFLSQKKTILQLKKVENNDFSRKKFSHFISNLRVVIEQNLEDESFGIQDLCKTIGLSRSQLHNKIKANTDLSTSIFIRQIRLEKSRALLRQTELNISEVAYAVGFKNPGYFSRLFSEKYGIPPSHYINASALVHK